jgi:hypothetical protein
MPTETVERKLVAILAADIAGSAGSLGSTAQIPNRSNLS